MRIGASKKTGLSVTVMVAMFNTLSISYVGQYTA